MIPQQTILFFGDSLTAGYGLSDSSSQSFPALIQKRIETDKLNYQIINAGVSGDTSASGLARLAYWLSRPIDVFVLELGINDILRGIPPSVTFRNLDAIVEKVRATYPHVKLALMGMNYLPSFLVRWRRNFVLFSASSRINITWNLFLFFWKA